MTNHIALARSDNDDIDVAALLAKGASDPDFAAAPVELADLIKAKLPRDLQSEFDASDVLGSLADDARAVLTRSFREDRAPGARAIPLFSP